MFRNFRNAIMQFQNDFSAIFYMELCFASEPRHCIPDIATTSAKFANDRWSVLVIHPKVRWGSGSASVLKQADRQLEEAVALVNNLPNMISVDSLIMPVDYNTKRKSIWASGNLEKLVARRETVRATALMINVDVLSPSQQEELFRIFGVPIFDRYNIVLATFKEFARTDEARLQIALAEIPYIKNRIPALSSKRLNSRPEILNLDEQYADIEGDLNEILRKREQDLRKKLKEVIRKRSDITSIRNSSDAVVAVVGYTNAGKTSLVKKLTGSAFLLPKDQLFATLDTTHHIAKLPSGRSVAFTDTIGFLSDLPIHLIAAFEATLAHVKTADVIIHLRDVSNHAWESQEEDVIFTLKSIGVSENVLNKRMIVVDNKIDKEGASDTSESNNSVRISCKTGEGMHQLINLINEKVNLITNCKTIRLRLDARSPVIEWLYHNGFVVVEPLADGNYLTFDVVMNESEIGQFRKKFAHMKKKSYIN